MGALVVTGIGTEVGKTIVSATLTMGLGASYWKPIQAGTDTDSKRIKELSGCTTYPEAYLLDAPESPHSSARKQGIEIDTDTIQLPDTNGPLIIEGAGGIMVPLNDETLFIDLFRDWALPVVVVTKLYLGAINHTLLTIDALEMRGIVVAGLVLNGDEAPDMENYIQNYTGKEIIGRIPALEEINATILKEVYDTYFNHQLLTDLIK